MLCDEDQNITQYVKVESPTNCPIAPPLSDMLLVDTLTQW